MHDNILFYEYLFIYTRYTCIQKAIKCVGTGDAAVAENELFMNIKTLLSTSYIYLRVRFDIHRTKQKKRTKTFRPKNNTNILSLARF